MATQIQAQDKTVSVNGLNLHYLDWGRLGKPPIILLHGLRGHAHAWDDVAAATCTDYHVLALDQRGRGGSDWAKDGDYSTDAYVADLAAFADALKLDSFVLVGHSMGGRNSMAFAAQYPQRLQKLVIVDIGPTVDPRGSTRISEEINAVPEAFDSFEAVVAYMSKQNRFASDAVMHRRLQYATKTLPDGQVGWCYDVAIRQQWRQGTAAPSVDLWPGLSKITCPTLIVRGMETDLLTSEVAQKMVEVLANATVVEIERAGHMVFEDNPQDFNHALATWLP
ncbi:MAG: alpha/beta hydrolase [bacterium]|nr:alpha/beta hydrolase [bacterium]